VAAAASSTNEQEEEEEYGWVHEIGCLSHFKIFSDLLKVD